MSAPAAPVLLEHHVCTLTGLSPSELDAHVRAGAFRKPRRNRNGAHCSWTVDDIEAWRRRNEWVERMRTLFVAENDGIAEIDDSLWQEREPYEVLARIHGCAHRFLSEYAFVGSELLYSDPPYLRHTRTSKHRYRFDYEEADHVELLELLKGVRCQVMVSGYGSALYEERLAGWRSVELQVMNHAGVRTECVWMNFAPDRLHWARYAGRNFTDRQRIKRKAESWGRRYAALSAPERLAVLGAMMAVEAQR